MKRLPTMKQLEYLVALADTQHFGRASERCHVTQSTLGAGIRDLESVLGTAVAERSNRRVLITRVGARIAERAKVLLRDAEEVMELARAGRSPMTGEMRLGVIPTIGPFYLPRVLPALRERFQELTIYLREEQTAPLLARLEDGELDVALIAVPYDTGDLDTEVIFEDEFLFACNRTHAFAGAGEVSLEALAGERLLLLRKVIACAATRWTSAGWATGGRGRSSRPAACIPWCRWWRRASASRSSRGSRSTLTSPGNGYLALAACGARVTPDWIGMAPDVVENRRIPIVGEHAAQPDGHGVILSDWAWDSRRLAVGSRRGFRKNG